MGGGDLTLRVECCAGYWDEETPRRFYLGTRKVEVLEVIDRWLDPTHGYFKVQGDDGAVYILHNDVPSGSWELTLFDGQGSGHSPSSSC
jgi:hypothetical protein